MPPLFDLNPSPFPNSPLLELKEEQHDLRLFLTVPRQQITSHQVINKYDGGYIDQQASSSSSSSLPSTVDRPTIDGGNPSFGSQEQRGYESTGDNNGISVKWMSSKMRLMKKMMNSNGGNNGPTDHDKAMKFTDKLRHRMHDNGETYYSFGRANHGTIRVCSDCNTTTTPLWRSGPRGPKSLCNACGIRQRKARRAMEAAAAATAETCSGIATDPATSMNNNNKEKKSRIGKFKRQQFKAPSGHNSLYNHQLSQKKLCFKEFALSLSKNSALQRVFPQDVEDAAILLMALSCGLVHG